MNRKTAIGWAGIGKMGSPMSRRVLSAGYPLTVYDPIAEDLTAVAGQGATVAHSLAELAESAEFVFLTVPNDQVLAEVVLAEEGLAAKMKKGQILVDMSTVSPRISSEVADRLSAKGIDYLRAPVSGSTATA